MNFWNETAVKTEELSFSELISDFLFTQEVYLFEIVYQHVSTILIIPTDL